MEFQDRIFGTQQLANILGETIHKTISYVNRGYVKPSVQDASGHGTKRLWNYLDVVRCLFVQILIDRGYTVDRIRELNKGITEGHFSQPIWVIPPEGTPTAVPQELTGRGSMLRNNDWLYQLFSADSPDCHVISLVHLHQLAQNRIQQNL